MKKTVLIIVSILIVIIISILGYKLYIKHLIAKDEIGYAKFLETAKFNKNFEKYDRLDIEYNTDDVNTLIDEVYNSNINKSNADYQYVTIPDVSLQFKDKIYEMKSTYDVEQLKERIEKENKKTYSFNIYYNEDTGFIYKIKILGVELWKENNITENKDNIIWNMEKGDFLYPFLFYYLH